MGQSRKHLKTRIEELEAEQARLKALVSAITDDFENLLTTLSKPIDKTVSPEDRKRIEQKLREEYTEVFNQADTSQAIDSAAGCQRCN